MKASSINFHAYFCGLKSCFPRCNIFVKLLIAVSAWCSTSFVYAESIQAGERWCVYNSFDWIPKSGECAGSAEEMAGKFFAYASQHFQPFGDGEFTVYRSFQDIKPCEEADIYGLIGVACPFEFRMRYVYSYTGDPGSDTIYNLDLQLFLACGRALGTAWDPNSNRCVQTNDISKEEVKQCPTVGNPVGPLNGVKYQRQPLLSWGRGHNLNADYNFMRKGVSDTLHLQGQMSFGDGWFSNVHKRGIWQNNYRDFGVLFQRGGGVWKSFFQYYRSDRNVLDVDPYPPIDSNLGRYYYDAESEAVETYQQISRDPRIASILTQTYADGRRLSYAYGAFTISKRATIQVIDSITDESGRMVRFQYEKVPFRFFRVRVKAVTDPAGQVYSFGYSEAGMLTTIDFPDGTRRTYNYDSPGKPWLISSLIDENGSVYGSYEYDGQGRAISTQTGGATGPKWTLEWSAPPQWQFIEQYDESRGALVRTLRRGDPTSVVVHGPDGQVSEMTSAIIDGATVLQSRGQPAGAGCDAATSSAEYDAFGNQTRKVDFNGTQSCHAYDAGRHLETRRVEGVGAGASCAPLLAASPTLPVGARMVSSQWIPVWRKQSQVAEPGRVTTYVYNGQPDPLNANAVASCAPADALLPDGKPIVVLCKRVEQATTDVNGAAGFNAAAQPGVAARTWSWTYDAQGRVLTEVDPRGKTVLTNEYYTDRTADHYPGDLKSATNVAGHVTSFPRYNAFGQALEVIDANGISTSYTYDARQRLTSVTQNGATTGYAYWPTGLLKQVTQPDGSFAAYDYDDAHRLVAVSDNQGNRIRYTLDQRGNRTKEEATDPSGALRRSMARVYDALSRTQQSTGRE
ncbi:hypothetical protein [Roseateles amylovorans]|uniref:RHS repeat protein n=1 Tax=Roseateles amylovorans TaxID=2978473 RepID=A0ABY6AYA9_9BURK|nr:hypothetical protein [Roseateles amylovorans]UXH76851.1 hypothetical protein N4261_17665 [Roseateles amylovorans]